MSLLDCPIISVLWPGSCLVVEVSLGLHSNLHTEITTGHQTVLIKTQTVTLTVTPTLLCNSTSRVSSINRCCELHAPAKSFFNHILFRSLLLIALISLRSNDRTT